MEASLIQTTTESNYKLIRSLKELKERVPDLVQKADVPCMDFGDACALRMERSLCSPSSEMKLGPFSKQQGTLS